MLDRKRGLPSIADNLDVQQVTDDVYTVQCNFMGQDAHCAYASWVITNEGVVVIDTGTPALGPLIRKEIAAQTNRPVKYVIYTHGHNDHAGGAHAFVGSEPKVIAHENTIPRFDRYRLTADYIRLTRSIQFHFNIPLSWHPLYPYPTETYRDEYHFELGGRTFELFHGKGETDDHTLVWMPESRVVFCGDLLEASFPNLGNPFKVMRYAEEWAVTLERALALGPNFAIGGDVVLIDKQKIREVFKDNIELLRFLQDSVITAANEGKNLEQMIEEIQLPLHLENSPNLKQVYSRREFAIYNIWKRYCGYSDYSASGLLHRPKREIAEVVRELIGKDEAILTKAEKLVQDGRLQLALETLDIILKVEYENVAARKLRLKILNELAKTDVCLMSRNVWMHYIDKDEAFLGLQ